MKQHRWPLSQHGISGQCAHVINNVVNAAIWNNTSRSTMTITFIIMQSWHWDAFKSKNITTSYKLIAFLLSSYFPVWLARISHLFSKATVSQSRSATGATLQVTCLPERRWRFSDTPGLKAGWKSPGPRYHHLKRLLYVLCLNLWESVKTHGFETQW